MILHNVCLVEGKNKRRNQRSLLSNVVIYEHGQVGNLQHTQWNASYKKVMCACAAWELQTPACSLDVTLDVTEPVTLAQEIDRFPGKKAK